MSEERERETVRGGSPSASPSSPVARGELIAGKYRVQGLLGAGGVGVVVEATHVGLDQPVAIKLLQPAAMADPETVGRFAREARAAVRIKSDHVAKILDVGELDNGVPYMVMEHLSGRDLGQLLRERTCLPVEEAVDIVLQASIAIAEAHALGIVHRDLKPANLFLTRRTDGAPHVKVLDFGISKFVPRDGSMADASMTQTATVVGSPLYMSPEQMESARAADERSDIWSLGTILFELVAGVPAFEAKTMPQLCARILNGSPTPLEDVAPDVPSGFAAVVERCLRRDPRDRYSHVGKLARDLKPYASPRGVMDADRVIGAAEAAGLDGLHETPPSMPGLLPFAATQPSDRDARVGTTTRPLTETRKWGRPPSKRVAVVLVGAGLGLGAALVLVQPNLDARPALAVRGGPYLVMQGERVVRDIQVESGQEGAMTEGPEAAVDSAPDGSAEAEPPPGDAPSADRAPAPATARPPGDGRVSPPAATPATKEPDVLDER